MRTRWKHAIGIAAVLLYHGAHAANPSIRPNGYVRSPEPMSREVPPAISGQAALKDHGILLALAEDPARASKAGEESDARTTNPIRSGRDMTEEVVVTAQKRQERLQDVPVPVTALNAESLLSQNQVRLQDYYARVPGLNVQVDGTTGVPTISIRGVTTGGQTNPTVGITVDDVPYGSSTFIGGGFVSPDIDPSDLERVEVLRGPQGTLYGVSSIGGLLKYVTADPSTASLEGYLQVGTTRPSNGDGLGHTTRGSINVPLSDVVAIRASGFTRRDAGYIDNARTGEEGTNSGRTSGGRVSGLWEISDAVSLKVSALLQNTEVNGASLVDTSPQFGDLQQNLLRDTGGYDRRFQAYSAHLTAELGAIDITAVTGYGVTKSSLSYDLTPTYGDFTESIYGVRGTPYTNDLKTTKFSQEIRLSGEMSQNVEWLVGAFYTREKSRYISDVYARDEVAGPVIDRSLHFINPTTYSDTAVFADLTYQFTDRFDVQLGGRQARIRHTDSAFGTGTLNGGDSITPLSRAQENSFTYLLTPRFKLSDDFMIYARMASGYRSGGPNANALVLGVPPHYDADETQNYDVGVKAGLMDNLLSIDASVYYIDWKDVQATLLAPGGGAVYIANGGRARSQGVELSLELRPVRGLTIASWVAWNDAELREDFPPDAAAYGVVGDRLPYSSRFSGNLSLDHEVSLASNVNLIMGAALSYVGERQGVFQASPVRQAFPSYAQTDLHVGADYGLWSVNMFMNNAFDRRGALTGGLDGPTPTSFIYVQPRTVGLTLARSF